MYYPPPPKVSTGHVVFFFGILGVAAFGVLGVKGLVLWLLPGVPPPGPFG